MQYVLSDTAALSRGSQTLGVQSGDALVARRVEKQPVLDLLQPYLKDKACQKKAFALEQR